MDIQPGNLTEAKAVIALMRKEQLVTMRELETARAEIRRLSKALGVSDDGDVKEFCVRTYIDNIGADAIDRASRHAVAWMERNGVAVTKEMRVVLDLLAATAEQNREPY